MDVPLALNYIRIRQGLKRFKRKSSTFSHMADVVGFLRYTYHALNQTYYYCYRIILTQKRKMSMKFYLLMFAFTILISSKVQAQNTYEERVDSSSFEFMRRQAHKRIMAFVDYYQFIADSKQDMSKRMYYVKKASSLFLPIQNSIITSTSSRTMRRTMEREYSVESFLRKVVRGHFREAINVISYEYCHSCVQNEISENEVEITFCKHGDTLRENKNVCIMPNGYVKGIFSKIERDMLQINLTKVCIVFNDEQE